MKKLLILPLLVLLTGCVTYYYPETALEDGVYYAEDDPSYVVYHGGYAGAAYYPWVSVDYFYMGYNPYPGYTYFYGFPFGFSYGFSPWHYPYSHFGYYSPLYASHHHYPHLPVWRPYSGYCAHDYRCGGRYMKDAGDEQNRQAGPVRKGRRDHDDEAVDDRELAEDILELPTGNGAYGTPPYRGYASTMPLGYSGNRGVVIRNSETTKIGKSRIEPDKSSRPVNGIVSAIPSSPTLVGPGHSTGSSLLTPSRSARTTPSSSASISTTRPSFSSAPRPSSRTSNRSRPSARSSSRSMSRASSTRNSEKRD